MDTPAFQLIMRQGPTPGLVYDLVKPEISIGRDITNDFVINDAEISRKHAVLRLEAGSCKTFISPAVNNCPDTDSVESWYFHSP